LVRILLGPEAIAEQKLECGPSLCVLGVDIAIGKRGFKCRPAVKKVDRWIHMIDVALEADKLLPGTYFLRVRTGTPPHLMLWRRRGGQQAGRQTLLGLLSIVPKARESHAQVLVFESPGALLLQLCV